MKPSRIFTTGHKNLITVFIISHFIDRLKTGYPQTKKQPPAKREAVLIIAVKLDTENALRDRHQAESQNRDRDTNYRVKQNVSRLRYGFRVAAGGDE